MPDEIVSSPETLKIVHKWINEEFRIWFGKYEGCSFEKASIENKRIQIFIKMDENEVKFELWEEDVEELYKCINEKREKELINDYNLKSIFKLPENEYITFLSSNEMKEIRAEKIKFKVGEINPSLLELELTNKIYYTHLYILVSNNSSIKINKKSFDESSDIIDLFSVFYITFKLKDADSFFSGNNIVELILSCIYFLNQRYSSCLFPIGMYNTIGSCPIGEIQEKIIFSSDDKSSEKLERDEPYPLFCYPTEALLYLIAAENNPDWRYKYLDYYHILEFFFDKVKLDRASKLLKESIKDPAVFFDDNKVHELASIIKNEITEKDYGDLSPPTFAISKIIKTVKEESSEFKKYPIEHIELEHIDDKHKIIRNLIDEKEEHIAIRIYHIRNGIVHSNKDIFKIVPNHTGTKYNNDLFFIKKVALCLINKYSKNNFI